MPNKPFTSNGPLISAGGREMVAERYRSMIEAFLGGVLSAERFERAFLDAFKSEPMGMDEDIYLVLDRLFGAVDAYWSECSPGEATPLCLSEQDLRREAADALGRLNDLHPRSVGLSAT